MLYFFMTFFLILPWAYAHDTHSDKISWGSWTFFELPTLGLIILTFLFIRGWRKKYKEARLPKYFWNRLRYFALSILTLILALNSPIDLLSDKLASVHMVQHTLLMMVAAPLLALSRPGIFLPWGMPKILLKSEWGKFFLRIWQFHRPLRIGALYFFVLWIWHIPYLYQGALKQPLLHDFQHISFFVASFLFWRVVLEARGKMKMAPTLPVLYLFVTSLHAMILGVLMALSPVVWYSSYLQTSLEYGVSPLSDQQIAGYIMWMPAGFTYVIVALVKMYQLLMNSNEIYSKE